MAKEGERSASKSELERAGRPGERKLPLRHRTGTAAARSFSFFSLHSPPPRFFLSATPRESERESGGRGKKGAAR